MRFAISMPRAISIVMLMLLISTTPSHARELFDNAFSSANVAETLQVWNPSQIPESKKGWTIESRQGVDALESPGQDSSISRPLETVENENYALVIAYGWRAGRGPGSADLRIGDDKQAVIVKILQQRGAKYEVFWFNGEHEKLIGRLDDPTLDAGVQSGGVAETPAELHLSFSADRKQLQVDRLGGGIVHVELPVAIPLKTLRVTDRSPGEEGLRVSRIRAYSGKVDPVSGAAQFSFPFGATFNEGTETPNLRVGAQWFSDESRRITLKGIASPVAGDASKSIPFELVSELKPRTSVSLKADALANLSPGLYQLRGELWVGEQKQPLQARFAVVSKDLASRSQEQIPRWVGMVPFINILARNTYSESFAYMEKIGVRHVRWLPGWGRLEPVENQYEWEESDEFMDLVAKHRMEAMFCLSYFGGDWATKKTNGELARSPAGRAMWVEKFAVPVVKRYGDRVKLYQIWNEPDAFWNPDPAKSTGFATAFGSPENYFDLLKRTHTAVHELGIKDVRIMASLASGEITHNTKLLLDMGLKEIFDGMIIHTYGNHPRHFVQLRDQLQKAGIEDPKLGSGETGLPRSDGDESSDMRQAMKVVNVLLSSTTFDTPLCVEWFVLHDRVAGGNFGLLDESYQPHPAATAYVTTARLLSGATKGTMQERGALNIYRVEREGRAPLFAISNPGVPTLITLECNDNPVVWDMFGRPSRPEVVNGRIDLMVEYAVLIEGDVKIQSSLVPTLSLTIPENGQPGLTVSCGADAANADASIRIDDLKWSSQAKLNEKGDVQFTLPAQIEAGRVYAAELVLNVRGVELKRMVNVEINRIAKVTDDEAASLTPPKRLATMTLNNAESFRPFNKKRTWDGIKDNSATLQLGWTDKLLVLWIQQQDDVHVPIPPQVPNPFGYDSAQWGFQAEGQLEPGATITDIVFGIMKSGKPMARVLGQPHYGPAIDAKREGTTTSYRVTIPASQLGIEAKPGSSFGMAININDNDGDGRKGWMHWGQGINGQRNASLFRRVVLETTPSDGAGK